MIILALKRYYTGSPERQICTPLRITRSTPILEKRNENLPRDTVEWKSRYADPANIGVDAFIPVLPSLQYWTQPSRFMFLMTVLKPSDPAAGPASLQKFGTKSAETSLGYSIWKTGFDAFVKAENVGQSENWTHCSLTEN
jgi:hypothetical protein